MATARKSDPGCPPDQPRRRPSPPPLSPYEPSERFTVKMPASDLAAVRAAAAKAGVRPSVLIRRALAAYLAA